MRIVMRIVIQNGFQLIKNVIPKSPIVNQNLMRKN